MTDSEVISEIFNKIKEEYDEPIPIGGRCESYVYYRTEDLTDEELDICAEYVAHRIHSVISPQSPHLFLKLKGGVTFFAERLHNIYCELYGRGEEIPLEQYSEIKLENGFGSKYKGKGIILATDVITTARSSLEAHSKITLRGSKVLCWASLIDRTFGPGPVPVVAAFTGAPVRLLTQLG